MRFDIACTAVARSAFSANTRLFLRIPASGYKGQAMTETALAGMSTPPDAIVAANDEMAFGAPRP